MAIQKICSIFFTALLLSLSRQVSAQAPTLQHPGSLDTHVTINVKEAPLNQFLEKLSAQSKTNFILAEGIEDKRVTAHLQNVSVDEALHTLLELKGLTYHRVGQSSTYIVTLKTEAGQPTNQFQITENSPALETKVTVKVKGSPLKKLLEQLSAQTKINFTIAKDLKNKRVTAYLHNVTVSEVLQVLVELKGINIRQTGKSDFAVEPNPKTQKP